MAVASLSLGACTWAFDWEREQCSVGADCEALGAGFEGAQCVSSRCERGLVAGAAGASGAAGGAPEGPWSCLAEPGSKATDTTATTFEGRVKSFAAAAVAGASVKACVVLDPDCRAPAAGPVLTDETGAFALALPASFSGYLEVSAAGYVPAIYSPLVANAGGAAINVDLLEPELADQIFAYVSAMVGRTGSLEEYGAVYARALDCTGAKTAGVRFSLESPGESTLVYFDNDTLDFAETQTTANGGAAFVFVAPGVNAVVATRVEGEVEVDRLGVVTRRGYLTTAVMSPGRWQF